MNRGQGAQSARLGSQHDASPASDSLHQARRGSLSMQPPASKRSNVAQPAHSGSQGPSQSMGAGTTQGGTRSASDLLQHLTARKNAAQPQADTGGAYSSDMLAVPHEELKQLTGNVQTLIEKVGKLEDEKASQLEASSKAAAAQAQALDSIHSTMQRVWGLHFVVDFHSDNLCFVR